MRILPGDTIASVLAHVRRVVRDNRVQVKQVGRFTAEPSRLSSPDSSSFRALERAIRHASPGVHVAPYLVVVATDSRYFSELSDAVFRFLPVRLAPADLQRMHGTNERIAIRDYERAIRIYRQLIVDTNSERI